MEQRADQEARRRGCALVSDVHDALQVHPCVVSITYDPAESRRLIGQTTAGRFVAVHVCLPEESIGGLAQAYLRRCAQHGGLAFAVGSIDDLNTWLRGLPA